MDGILQINEDFCKLIFVQEIAMDVHLKHTVLA